MNENRTRLLEFWGETRAEESVWEVFCREVTFEAEVGRGKEEYSKGI